MPDIRLVQFSQFAGPVLLDWMLTPLGQLDEAAQLQTAVIVALGTDARAAATDALPNPGDDDLRGWWGDLDAATIWGGWPIGIKLWLLQRAKITGEGAAEGPTVGKVQNYINATLRPFVQAKIVTSFTALVTRADRSEIDAAITLYRGPKPSVALQWQALWNNLAAGV